MTAVPHVSLPPDVDLVVPQEITLSTPWMKAIAVYMGSSCEKEMNEYMLLRREYDNDPRKVLKEGREVTACGVRFIRELRKQCLDEVTAYARCLDHSKRGEMLPTNCRRVQYPLDICVEEKMGIKRPPVGHFSKLHVHESEVQPPPIRYNRDFKAEAKELMTELPDDWHLQRGRNRRYRPAYLDFFSNDT